MGGLLTKKHKELIKHLATRKDKIYLFEADSLSGDSETLRYHRDWIEHGRWGSSPRYMTGMVFSVKVYKANKRDIVAYNRFKEMVKEAKTLFNKYRRQ